LDETKGIWHWHVKYPFQQFSNFDISVSA